MHPAVALRCLLRRPAAARTALPLPSRAASTITSNADRSGAAATDEASPAADDEKKRGASPERKAAPPYAEDTKPRHDVPPPFAPSPRLESHDVPTPPWPPGLQQKRRLSATADPAAVASVACVGPDGTPLGGSKKESEDDYREYFAHRKPSPLAEVEFVDTRKPITRATDSVRVGEEDTGRGRVMEETMEETLARVEAIWRMRKAMGDPDLPHSRALRRMLGEAVGEAPLY